MCDKIDVGLVDRLTVLEPGAVDPGKNTLRLTTSLEPALCRCFATAV
jgi:hypothetical protein